MEYFLLSLALFLPGATGQDCSNLEYKSAQKLFNDCTTEYHDKVHEVVQDKPSRDTQRLVCEYVNTAVEECGDLLLSCQDTHGKDTNSQALVDGFISVGGKYTRNCQAILQYRKLGLLPIENTSIQGMNEINKDITQNNNVEDIQKDNDLTNQHISNEACSQANTDAAEDFMDKCSQKIGNEAYSKMSNSKDPDFIANVLCSTEAQIIADCAQNLKKCFSSEYIDFLVKPIKTFLHNLAARRVDEDSLKNCHEFNSLDGDKADNKDNDKDPIAEPLSMEKAPIQNINEINTDITQKRTQNLRDIQKENDLINLQISNETCPYSNTDIAENFMDNCSQKIGDEAYLKISNSKDPVYISNVLCESEALIYADCVQDLKKCLSSEDIDWLVEPIKAFLHKLAVTNVDENSLKKCHEINSLDEDKIGNKDNGKDKIMELLKSRDQELGSQESYAEHIANNEWDYLDKTGDKDDVVELEYEETDNNHQFREAATKSEYHKTSDKYHKQELVEEKYTKQILAKDTRDDEMTYINEESRDLEKDNEEPNMCSEASVIEGIGKCSHSAALKVHTEMHNSTDPNILKDIACDVLNVIAKDCVQEVYDCFSKIDADEIRHNHVEDYKGLIIEMIQVRSGIKLSLENCKGLTAEPTEENYSRETPMDNQNQYNENDRKNEIIHDKSGEENKLCSVSERTIDEDEIKTCITSIVNNANSEINNTTDPSSIARIFCSIRRRIDTDCVQHLRKCLPSEYISWYVDPLKTQLQELIVHKVDAKYLEKCHEIKPSYKAEGHTSYAEHLSAPSNLHGYETEHYHETGDYEYYPQENEPTHSEELKYHAQELRQYRDDSCSETILYERMDNCSRGIATKVWNDIKDDSISHRASNIACDGLTDIGTRCVSVLNNCFTSKEVSEMKSVQTKQWIEYFYRITDGTRLGRVYLENCHLMIDQQDNTDDRGTDNRISYNRQETELYDKPEQTQDTINQIQRTNPWEPYYAEETANKHHEEYEECSTTKQEQTLKEMTDFSNSVAVNVHSQLQTTDDPAIETNIICNALNNIATNCVNVLYKCYTPDNIKDLKFRELLRAKNYFLKLVGNDYDSGYLENCEAIREINDHHSQEKIQSKNQEYYSQRINTQSHHDIQDDTSHEREEGCSEYQRHLADDHMNECIRRTATDAVEQLRDISEPNKAFNILCSALTTINSDCVKTMRECHTEEDVTWMLDPMNKYLFDLGKEKVDEESLRGCQYSNGFSPYRLP